MERELEGRRDKGRETERQSHRPRQTERERDTHRELSQVLCRCMIRSTLYSSIKGHHWPLQYLLLGEQGSVK